MSRYKAYPEYKGLGVEWANILPSHWGATKLRRISNLYAGGTPSKAIEEYWDNGSVPWLNSGEVNQGLIREASTYITEAAYKSSSAKWIPKNALVIALAGQGKTKGMVAQLAINATCNQSMGAIVPHALNKSRFIYWWLHSNYKNIRNMAGGDLRDGLNLELLGNIECPTVDENEQLSIAAFLDHETAKIDALIEKQRRLIELLKEKRQAVISHAVTKGLDPNAPMKESGVEWLGDVPAHWRVTQLKHATSMIVDCPHETPVYSEAGQYLVIRTADLNEGQLYSTDMYRVDDDEYALRTRRADLRKGDIVYGREGERWGHAALVPESSRYCLGQRMMQFRATSFFCSDFLMWLLNSDNVYKQGQVDTVGATSPHVNVGTIRNFSLTRPSLSEQQEISQFLNDKTRRLDELVLKASNTISLLQERRTALISAAVTGKIDVRDWQAAA